MPLYRSTRNSWIVAQDVRHARLIEEATSREQLLQPLREQDGVTHSYLSLQSGSLDTQNPATEPSGPEDTEKDVSIHCAPLTTQRTNCKPANGSPPEKEKSSVESYSFQIREASSLLRIQNEKQFRKTTYKNLSVLGVAFMLLFTAFASLQSLQSSLNASQGLGLTSLSCLYAATVISCIFAPAVIGRLTTKWTLVLAVAVYVLYFLSNLQPSLAVLLPASVLLGLVTGPLWSAQATYLTTLAIRHAGASGQLRDSVISLFNGVFCGFLQTSQVWGNLLSAGILSSDNVTVHLNEINKSHLRSVCGSKDCAAHDYFPDASLPHHIPPVDPETRALLLGSQAGCALLALGLIVIFLDKNAINVSLEKTSVSLSSQQLLLATVRILKDSRLLALSPLVLFSGLEQGFVLGDYTKSYVNCALGIHQIGFVMMSFGAVNALASVLVGHVARHVKRYPVIVAGSLFNTGLLIVLLWWRPSNEDLPMFYVIAGCLGLCDAIWQTQTNTLFGILFSDNQEAAFAVYRMCQSLGFAAAFGYSYFLCVRIKVYILGGVLIVSLVFYTAVEFKYQQSKKLCQGLVVL